jgi:hypothetical protein
LSEFAEAWAQRILQEGWLEQGEQLPDPPWIVNEEALWASMYADADEIDDPATRAGEEALCDDVPF